MAASSGRAFRLLATTGLGLTLVLGACSATPGADEPGPAESTDTPVAEDPEPAEDEGAGNDEGSGEASDGDYAFGTNREQVATAIEAPFSNRGGQARWEGDTLVLTLDGDNGSPIPGFTECRVVIGLINEEDSAAIEFPDGRIDCDEVLTD